MSLLTAASWLVPDSHAWAQACTEPVQVDSVVLLACGQRYNGFAVPRDTVVYSRIVAADTSACDTVYAVTLDVVGNDYYRSDTLCAGEQLRIGASTIQVSGDYDIAVPRPGRCDSVVHARVEVLRPVESFFTLPLCAGDAFEGVRFSADTTLRRLGTSRLGCDSTAVIEIDVFSAEALSVTGERRACRGQAISLQASGGYADYRWSDGQVGREARFESGEAATLTVSSSAGCVSTLSVAFEFLELSVEAAGYGGDCPGDPGRVEAVDIIDGVGPFAYALSEAPQQADSVFRDVAPGEYTVVVTDGLGCTASADVTVPEASQRAIGVAGIPSGPIPIKEPTTIQVRGIDSASVRSIRWQSPGVVTCRDCYTTTWLPAGSGAIAVDVETVGGCTLRAEATVALRERNALYVPNAFSPNGDGENDVLSAYATDAITGVEAFVVSDRWGGLVQIRGPDEAPTGEATPLWDGLDARGREAPPGVYAYRLVLRFDDGELREHSGDLSLVR